MYYCKYCETELSSDELKAEQKCFETEYGVGNLFPDKHYYTDYKCPICGGEVEEAMKCDMCGEYYPEDDLEDTDEYINGGCGYCCQDCIEDANMVAI